MCAIRKPKCTPREINDHSVTKEITLCSIKNSGQHLTEYLLKGYKSIGIYIKFRHYFYIQFSKALVTVSLVQSTEGKAKATGEKGSELRWRICHRQGGTDRSGTT